MFDRDVIRRQIGFLKFDKANSAELRKLERELWVLDGVCNEALDEQILQNIADKYVAIDAVPSGYLYPELFIEYCPVEA